MAKDLTVAEVGDLVHTAATSTEPIIAINAKRMLVKRSPVAVLIRLLRDSTSANDKRVIIEVLKLCRAKSAVPDVLAALDDPDSEVRLEAADTLMTIARARDGESIYAHFKGESDNAVKAFLVLCLGIIRFERAIDDMMTSLKDNYPLTRSYAALSLEMLHATIAYDNLVCALNQEQDKEAKRILQHAINQLRPTE